MILRLMYNNTFIVMCTVPLHGSEGHFLRTHTGCGTLDIDRAAVDWALLKVTGPLQLQRLVGKDRITQQQGEIRGRLGLPRISHKSISHAGATNICKSAMRNQPPSTSRPPTHTHTCTETETATVVSCWCTLIFIVLHPFVPARLSSRSSALRAPERCAAHSDELSRGRSGGRRPRQTVVSPAHRPTTHTYKPSLQTCSCKSWACSR